MKNMSRKSALALLAATAAIALTACNSSTAGTPGMADLSEGYTGPALNTDAPDEATQLAPGIDIRVGTGKNAVTCTAGWMFSFDTSAVAMTIPGHCARAGAGAPVTFEYLEQGKTKTLNGTETVTIGKVIDTSYKEPYTADNPDIAVVLIDKGVEDKVPVTPAAGGKVVTNEPTPIYPKNAAQEAGAKVCWYSGAEHMEYTVGKQSCGKMVSGAGNKILVKPDKPEEFEPVVAGAPAIITLGPKNTVPLGIVTDMYKDHIVVDVLDTVVDSVSGKILTASLPK